MGYKGIWPVMLLSSDPRAYARSLRPALMASICALSMLLPASALGQRGEAFVIQEPPAEAPRAGFPGAFNTHTVERGRTVGSFPLLQVDQGITDNLSLGVNLIPSLPALGGALPGGLGRLRYRVYDDGRWSSIATLQAGYMPISADDPEGIDRVWGVYASMTVGLQLSARQRLATTALAATIRLANDAYLERYQFDVVGVALDYEAFATDRLGMSVTAIGAPSLATSLDSPGATATLTFNPSPTDRVLLRGLALFKPGSRWLLEAGGIAPLSLAGAVPWFGASRIW
jgi:hypothetical protein